MFHVIFDKCNLMAFSIMLSSQLPPPPLPNNFNKIWIKFSLILAIPFENYFLSNINSMYHIFFIKFISM
jgi:hypothetical protein